MKNMSLIKLRWEVDYASFAKSESKFISQVRMENGEQEGYDLLEADKWQSHFSGKKRG